MRFKDIRVDLIFCIMGFSAMVGQVLLLRRSMAIFGGNELVVGAVFFGWVFWAGLGNLVFAYIADRVRDIPRLLSLTLNLIALALPLTLLATSLVKTALGYPPSYLVGLPAVAAMAIALLAPFCFLVGASMTVAAKLPATGRARDIGVMYLFDALGAGIGGLVATWFAIRAFTSFQVAVMTVILLVFFNAAILVRKFSTQVLTVFVALCAVVALWLAPGIETWAVNQRWQGYHPTVNIDSHFGNLVVTEQGDEHTLFADGIPQFSTPLVETYETNALLPLLMHPDPKRVLLIGGGLSGMLANWRDVPLDSIVYLQVDREITRLEQTAMRAGETMNDKRVDTKHVDALSFLDGCAPDKRFDVIVLNVADPDTASGSRLLTDRFFEQAKCSLAPGGVFSFGIFEPGNAIGPEAAKLLGTVRATLAHVFDNMVMLPFDRFYFIASTSDKFITDDPAMLGERIKERAYVAPLLTGDYLASVFPERIQSMNAVVAEAAEYAPRNTMLRPSAYFTGLLLWASRTGGVALASLSWVAELSWLWFAGLLVMAAIASILSGKIHRRSLLRISSFWALFAIGFGAIVYEITLLIYYQMRFGLLFYRIGIIITAFMVGLSLGAYLSIRLFQRVRIRTIYLVVGLLAFAAYQPLLFWVSGVSFTSANFICGMFGGFLFEATAEWLVAGREEIGHTAGWLNCADYWGSAAGALLASIITIPLYGLPPSLLIAAVLPFTAAAVLAVSSLTSKA